MHSSFQGFPNLNNLQKLIGTKLVNLWTFLPFLGNPTSKVATNFLVCPWNNEPDHGTQSGRACAYYPQPSKLDIYHLNDLDDLERLTSHANTCATSVYLCIRSQDLFKVAGLIPGRDLRLNACPVLVAQPYCSKLINAQINAPLT